MTAAALLEAVGPLAVERAHAVEEPGAAGRILAQRVLLVAAIARDRPWFHLPYFALVCYGTLFLAFVPRLPRIRHHDLSYGLYLYGWPSAQLVQQFSPGTPMHNVAWATPLALLLAAGSWFLVERPALSWKRRLGTRTPKAAPDLSAHAGERAGTSA